MLHETKRETAIVFAVAAWLFLITSMWLPWWLVRYTDGSGARYDSLGAWLWRPTAELTVSWAPWLTGILVAALALLLFARIAGRSWYHEPWIWRRDLVLAAVVTALTLASTMLWPDPTNFTSFWGGRTFTDTASGATFTESTLPGLGWWCAAIAFGCLTGAALLAKQAGDATDK